MKDDLLPFYKEREFTLNTTPERFAAWLQKHVKAGLITPPGAKIHIGIAQFTPPPNIGLTARLKIHGYIEKPDPEEDGAYLRSHLPGVIQFELVPSLTREGVEVRAECHDPALMQYFDELLAKIERDATLTLTRGRADDKRFGEILTRGGNMDWDVFISHAWEDKEDIARPLAEALRRKGLRVWYDEFTLTLGDSLRRSIDRGLAQSRYGVVILSPHFFAKEWPQRELDGLVAREDGSEKVILPVWHNVTREDVSRFSPTLADKLAVSTEKGIDAVVEEILRALRVGVKPESTREDHRPSPPSVAKRTPAKPRRPVNWEKVGAIAQVIGLIGLPIAVIGVLIALGAWLVPNVADFFSTWLFETATVISTPTPTLTPYGPTAWQAVVSGPTLEIVSPTPSASLPDMVYVPAGEFIMGSSGDDVDYALALCNEYRGDCERSWFEDEQPAHTVYLDAFYIDRAEVTNAQFAQFLNEQGNQEEGGVPWLDIGSEYCLITQTGEQYQPKSDYEDHPVIEVSWSGANAYCQWAGKRLPTEAEWEKTARGTDRRTYPWGNDFDCHKGNFDDEQEIDDDVVPGGPDCDGYVRTAPVGSFPAGVSPYGALDMVGNAWEWVADWHDGGYYSQSPGHNPQGPDSGEARALRGGSWLHNLGYARCASRYGGLPRSWYNLVGFRCAMSSP